MGSTDQGIEVGVSGVQSGSQDIVSKFSLWQINNGDHIGDQGLYVI